LQVADDYNFPVGNAPNQTIGVLEFSDPVYGLCGYLPNDVADYFTTNLGIGPGLTAPMPKNVTVNGPGNSPGGANDTEVLMDICVSAAVAQQAGVNVYFSTWDENGWVLSIKEVIHPTQGETKPSVVSISWDAAELVKTSDQSNFYWTAMAMNQVSANAI
jgi:kumamolisin